MDKAKLIDQASGLMGRQVYDVVAIRRRPRWFLVLTLPIVIAGVLNYFIWPPFWLLGLCALAGVAIWMVTETRFLAFAASDCALLRGRRWLPASVKSLEKELLIGDLKVFITTIDVAEHEYSISRADAQRLSETLMRRRPTRSEIHE